MQELFRIADANLDGSVTTTELARLLKMSGFNFSSDEVGSLVANCDANGDGLVQYNEFLPMMVDVMNTRDSSVTNRGGATPTRPSLDDIPAEEMTEYLQRLFQIADTNQDGHVTNTELSRLLQMSGFQFSALQALFELGVGVGVGFRALHAELFGASLCLGSCSRHE